MGSNRSLSCRGASRFSRSILSIGIASLFLLAPLTLAAQTSTQAAAAPSTPSFEVASFRIAAENDHLFATSQPDSNEFFVKNSTLASLMVLAFGDVQVKGEPAWFYKTAYTIRAKAANEQKLTPEQKKIALQQLLKDRLHLRYHSEVIQTPGYGLIARKDGSKLEESKGGPHRLSFRENTQEGRITALNATMQEIAQVLGRALHSLPAVDATGLQGKYDVQFSYAAPLATDSNLPHLQTILKDQLGLEFVKRQIPVQTIMIDSVEETPSEN